MPTPASPGTNEFRCNACGRFFNSPEDLAQHEVDCRAAKEATGHGRAELAEADATPHPKNDHGIDPRGN